MLNLSYSKEVILLSLVFLASYFTIDLFLIFFFLVYLRDTSLPRCSDLGLSEGKGQEPIQNGRTSRSVSGTWSQEASPLRPSVFLCGKLRSGTRAGIQSKHSSVGCVPNVHNQRTNKREILRIVH